MSHDAIIAALQAAGAENEFIELLENLSKGNKTRLLTSQGLSDEIPIEQGVKQGCPLSGPIFNLGINPIFWIIQALRKNIHCLGYADYIVVIEDSIEALQEAIKSIVDFAAKLGLQFNVRKCRMIHINPTRNTCQPNQFYIEETPIPKMMEFEPDKYLGKPFTSLRTTLKSMGSSKPDLTSLPPSLHHGNVLMLLKASSTRP